MIRKLVNAAIIIAHPLSAALLIWGAFLTGWAAFHTNTSHIFAGYATAALISSIMALFAVIACIDLVRDALED